MLELGQKQVNFEGLGFYFEISFVNSPCDLLSFSGFFFGHAVVSFSAEFEPETSVSTVLGLQIILQSPGEEEAG